MSSSPRPTPLIRLREQATVRPLHVVMIVLTLGTLAGASLLLSAAESPIPIDGALPWSEESPLRAFVQLLCLNYSWATTHAGDVKGYVLALGTGLSLLALAIAMAVRPRFDDEAVASVAPASEAESTVNDTPADGSLAKVQLSPWYAAQALFLAYVGWSYVSSAWSSASDLAVGASILLTIQLLFALVIAYGLGPHAARIVTRGVMIIAVVTALAAVWYYYGRNPNIRAKFPSGNPNFLAASLIPGILLMVTYIGETLTTWRPADRGRAALRVTAAIAGLAVTTWAVVLTSSRSVQLGLAYGLIAILFFALRGRAKLGAVSLACVLTIVAGAFYAAQADEPSPTGRTASQRLRGFAWSYAWRMFDERPLIGHGQAGFVLHGDQYAVGDVLADPQALESRLANAHNEWFQVLAELGSVGFVLVLAALVVTFLAGSAALASDPPPGQRWALVGAMGALAALCVSECFGVGLRVADVPPFFFGTLGLVWALSSPQAAAPLAWLTAVAARRVATGVVGTVLAIAVFLAAQGDFHSARQAYRVHEELEAGRYDEAVELAMRGTGSLNPERALANLRQSARAHAHVALKYQQSAADRESRARAGEVIDQNLLRLASEDRARCDAHARAGLMAVKSLVEKSPGYFDHGRVLYELNMILAHQAAARGDLMQRDLYIRDAGEALARELQRQPFDAGLAVEFVRTTAGSVDLAVVLEVLARPLRFGPMPPGYAAILQPLAADPEFEGNFTPFRETAEARCENPGAPVVLPGPAEAWAPEVLRLASAIRTGLGDFAEGLRLLNIAARFYRTMADDYPLATASTFDELSMAQFYHAPNKPAEALQFAREALAFAPPSLIGRRLAASVRQKMIIMHLASGDESSAGVLLKEIAIGPVSEAAVTREIGARYARLAYQLLQRPAGGVLRQPATEIKPHLARWVQRAIELNPDDFLGHYLAADLAFLDGDDAATAAHLRAALAAGMDASVARQFLSVARQQLPDSEALREVEEAIGPGAGTRNSPTLSSESFPLPNADADSDNGEP